MAVSFSSPTTRGASFIAGAARRARQQPQSIISNEGRLVSSHRFLHPSSSLQIIREASSMTPESTTRFFPSRFRIPIAGRRQRVSQKRHNCQPDGARRANSSSASSEGTVVATKAPSFGTLRWVAFTTGLPFIGFGFMDNAILIIAGDAIDTSLGVTLGISTMCAAAIGNIVSDLAGIGCAAYIEEFCATTLKLPVPKLSGAQRQLRSVRMASQGGMAIGMTVGCLLGMIPLLFIDANRADKLREKARLENLYKDVLNEAKTLVEAEATCLYLRVDRDEPGHSNRRGVGILPDYHPSVHGKYLYAMFYVEPQNNSRATSTLMRMVSSGSRPMSIDASAEDGKTAPPNSGRNTERAEKAGDAAPVQLPHPTRVIPIGKGIVSRVVHSGTTWNIAGDLIDEEDFFPLSFENGTHRDVDREHYRDLAVVPILDARGRVIAVLEALNKERAEGYEHQYNEDEDDLGGFTEQDVEILVSLASHVSVSLQRIYQIGEEEEEDFGLRDTIRILKESKGIKRSITRRHSIRSDTNSDTKSNTKNNYNRRSTTAGKKNLQLFPD